MAIAGRVAIVPKGDWSADATYKRLDAVTYNNTLYFAKKEVPAGTETSNTEYWSKSIVGGAGSIATKEDVGIVKPADGLTVAEDGTLKVSIDGTTLTMDQVNNVIKLADTLKEKIGSALQPESIVNNQITTVEGFALDARQANPNIDGTLAKKLSDLNGSLTFENSPMVSKKYNLAKNGSITIPCLNCIIFFVGHLASHFLIATTVGYQSDSIRSRVSFVNGNEQIGVTIAYSKEDTLEAYSGKFTISNTRDSMDVIVIGIKNYSKV